MDTSPLHEPTIAGGQWIVWGRNGGRLELLHRKPSANYSSCGTRYEAMLVELTVASCPALLRISRLLLLAFGKAPTVVDKTLLLTNNVKSNLRASQEGSIRKRRLDLALLKEP